MSGYCRVASTRPVVLVVVAVVLVLQLYPASSLLEEPQLQSSTVHYGSQHQAQGTESSRQSEEELGEERYGANWRGLSLNQYSPTNEGEELAEQGNHLQPKKSPIQLSTNSEHHSRAHADTSKPDFSWSEMVPDRGLTPTRQHTSKSDNPPNPNPSSRDTGGDGLIGSLFYDPVTASPPSPTAPTIDHDTGEAQGKSMHKLYPVKNHLPPPAPRHTSGADNRHASHSPHGERERRLQDDESDKSDVGGSVQLESPGYKPAVYKRVIPYRARDSNSAAESFLIETINFNPNAFNKLEIVEEEQEAVSSDTGGVAPNSPRYSREALPSQAPDTFDYNTTDVYPTPITQAARAAGNDTSNVNPHLPHQKHPTSNASLILGTLNRSPAYVDDQWRSRGETDMTMDKRVVSELLNHHPDPASETESLLHHVDISAFVDLEQEPIPESEPVPEAEPESAPEEEMDATEETLTEPETEHGASEAHVEPAPEAESEHLTNWTDVVFEEDNPYAEPDPNWPVAKAMWGFAWEFHVYVLGTAFAIIAVYSLISVIRLSSHKNLLSQGYFIALNSIMFVMGLVRALFLLVDAYNSNGTFNIVLAYFLYSVGFPCMTSAFSILFFALLQSTQMKLLSPRIQKIQVLLGIIAFHFVVSILTDIVTGYLSSSKVMLLVCQVATLAWGLALFCAYFYMFRKLYRSAMRRQKEMARLVLARLKVNGMETIEKPPKWTLNVAVKVTMVTALLGLVGALLQLYGMFGVYYMFSTSYPEPWAWWVFMFGLRLTELGMCVTMSYVATQPFRYHQPLAEKQGKVWSFLYLAPCRRFCDCEKQLHNTDPHWNDVEFNENSEDNVNPYGGHQYVSMPMNVSNGAPAHCVHPPSEPSPSTSANTSTRTARPASLLINDGGFIRFRKDGDHEGDPVMLSSTDDELEGNLNDYINKSFPVYYMTINDLQSQSSVASRDGSRLSPKIPLADAEQTDSADDYSDQLSPLGGRPHTGTSTPITPKSMCSTGGLSMFSFRPPSSIHLRDSIENALDLNFTLATPATWTPEQMVSPSHCVPLSRTYSSSMNDLQFCSRQSSMYYLPKSSNVSLNSRQSWCNDNNRHNRRRHSSAGYASSMSSLGMMRDSNGNSALSPDLDTQEAMSDINRICNAINQLSTRSAESSESFVYV